MIKRKRFTHVVSSTLEDNKRLRSYLKGVFLYLETGSAVKRAIERGQIFINGRIGYTGDWVSAGDRIEYIFEYEVQNSKRDDLDILFEDKDIMILRKPAGLASSGNRRSLQGQLRMVEIEDELGSLPFPQLVHRLDRATEGLILAAKTIGSRRKLGAMFENRQINKEYMLVVSGHLSANLSGIDDMLDNKTARTEILESHWLNTKDKTSCVWVRLHTGRTHQIRRHFKIIGHPLVGDDIYNKGGLNFGTGLLLCAFKIEFEHPHSGQRVSVEMKIPQKIAKYRPMNT